MQPCAVVAAGKIAARHACRPCNESRKRTAPLAQQEAAAEHIAAAQRHNGQHYHGHINNHDDYYCRQKIVEQLHGLAHIGGNKIEKHVDSYNRMAEKIEQHYLEGGQKHQRKKQQSRLAGLTSQRHEQPYGRHGQHDVGDGGHDAHALGEAQSHVGYRQHGNSKPEYAAR